MDSSPANSPPQSSLCINRGAFIASATAAFLLIAAPFELVAFGVMATGSTAYPWWSIVMPGVVSLAVGVAIIVALPRGPIRSLAMSFGLSCLAGVIVIAAAVCSHLVALIKVSMFPSPLSSQAEFIGVVCAFSIPFGWLYGVFIYGAATRSLEAAGQ